MGYGYYQNPQYYEAQQRAREQRIQNKHDEKLNSLPNGGMGGPDRSKLDTPFMKMSIPELRSMILDADPNRIYEVSQHWKSIHNILSGGDGDGKSGGVDSVSAKDSVAGMMQSAVENVLEYWEGDAAEAFRKKANEILQNVRNGAAWANYYGESMAGVQNDLRNSISKMREVEEPGFWDKAWDKLWDDERNDEQLLEDINKGVSTDAARQANADSLSAGKEAQLQGVAIMEQLAVNYKAYSKAGIRDESPTDPFQPPNPQTPMPTPISMPTGGGSSPGMRGGAPTSWSAGSTSSVGTVPSVSRSPGITGGSQLPTAKTKIDSLSPGLSGNGPVAGGGGGLGGGATTGGVQGPGIVTSGGASGLVGGAVARGGLGTPIGRNGTANGAEAGRNNGGRAGMGGVGGAGAGAAGRGGTSAGGRGAIAKSRGGVIGAAKGVAGKGTGGGAGLHGSRGGTQRGAMAGGGGGLGGRNGRRPEDENSHGDRPDYLVEDEETWISEDDRNRNVPRTIE
ncbi:WXG100 family type VII secretion target [Streptomyces zinciresistens]|uniref:WXG100 family type VII secretion target n=1 Tax=Streptomyces zinciresistens TaxID=1073330 RepID=UPI001111B2E5|nr:WXG100 family type VII secretion target [Streptomyces zinciresistens]